MKIRKINAYPLNATWVKYFGGEENVPESLMHPSSNFKYSRRLGQHTTLVEVVGEDGMKGYGECFGLPDALYSSLYVSRYFDPVLRGLDTDDPVKIWRIMMHMADGIGNTAGAMMEALSGIDTAVWDLKGKEHHLPVFSLLGGRINDKIGCYGTPVMLFSDVGKTKARAKELLDMGFTSIKLKIGRRNRDKVICRRQQAIITSMGSSRISTVISLGCSHNWLYRISRNAAIFSESSMVSGTPAFRRVISNGLVLDRKGEKMSKRLGNAVDPFKALDSYGPDALRWYMLTNAQPWDNLKFDEAGVEEVRRKFFGTLYNSYSVFALYANIDSFDPSSAAVPVAERPMFDRWIISRLNTLVASVRAAYEDYDITAAGRLVQDFVCDDLSNWYIRLNKKRLWGSGLGKDKLSAYQTLYEALKTVAVLAAPIAPFFMDRLWHDLVPGADSVHYVFMPSSDASLVDKDLEESMAFAQKASSMVLALRKKVGINVRKPLAKVLVPVLDDAVKEHILRVRDIFLTEVNVKDIEFLHDTTGIITKKMKPNFKTLGKIYGKRMKDIAAAFAALSQEQIAEVERAAGDYVLALPGGDVVLRKGDYEISSEDMPGWLVASEGALTLALDIVQTPELKREGTARELIHPIQNLRKESGFEVTDRINTTIYADGENYGEIEASLGEYADYVAGQTLSLSLELRRMSEAPADAAEVEWGGSSVRIKVSRN